LDRLFTNRVKLPGLTGQFSPGALKITLISSGVKSSEWFLELEIIFQFKYFEYTSALFEQSKE
jgi:hypothetical protein